MKLRLCLAKSTAAIMIASTALIMQVPLARPAAANTVLENVIPPSEAVTFQAKIRKVDVETREIELVSPTGDVLTMVAGPLVRINLLKKGQTVNATYYRSVAFYISPPKGGNGTPVSNDKLAQAVVQPAHAPGGVVVQVIKVSGTVVGIDLASHTIDLVNPSGGSVYTIDVTDPNRIAALSSLKVGDTITAVVSAVLAISIEPAPKSWF